ncbi:MAG: hypothetical protein ACI8TP_004094 [Acidimicrobiales bacterium]|jgi:hypothetical protein
MTEQPNKAVSASRVIPADAATIFDLLADPRRHQEIDGSDTVRGSALEAPDRLALGARFGMSMKMFGIPYRMSNEVVEFVENECIAWRHFGHHIWRYELRSVDSGTEVTETFEWGTARPLPVLYEWIGYPKAHEGNMQRTLERLERAIAT